MCVGTGKLVPPLYDFLGTSMVRVRETNGGKVKLKISRKEYLTAELHEEGEVKPDVLKLGRILSVSLGEFTSNVIRSPSLSSDTCTRYEPTGQATLTVTFQLDTRPLR